MCRFLTVALVFALAVAAPARAFDLYAGEVQVPDQSAEERLKAVPAALIQVLQKHSGLRELPLHPALDAALLGATRILVSYHYREHERRAPDGTLTAEWRLVARFLPEAVDRIVQDLELPRWRAERRPVTIWIVVDDGPGRRLLPVEYGYVRDALDDLAGIRGLPLAWPDPDEEELERLDLQMLWGGFADEFPDPYGGGVAIVAARREGPDWNVRWNYAGGGAVSGWRNRDTDLAFALVDGLHRLADLVAARDSIAASAQGEWTTEVRVLGLRGTADYARALAYLESLSVVDAVTVSEAGPGSVRFRLDLNAMPEYLQSELQRDRFFQAGPVANEYWLTGALVPAAGPEGTQ